MSTGRVLVTGASGFIGGHVAVHLNAGPVTGAGRGDRPSRFAGDWIKLGDVIDPAMLAGKLRGLDVVVHAAGRAHVRRETATDPMAAYRATNVEGSRATALAAAKAGVRRFILLSSVAVYGARTGRIDELTPVAPVSPYGISRLEAEQAVAEVSRASGMELVILRLPMVYGPEMKGNPLILFRFVDRGQPLPLGAIRNARSLLYVGNVAAAVSGAMRSPLPQGQATYLVADAEPVSTPQLAREIATALGRPCTLLPVPVAALRVLARVGTAVAGHRFPLSAHALQSLVSTLVIDASPLAAALGSSPPFGRKDALGITARWYRERPPGT